MNQACLIYTRTHLLSIPFPKKFFPRHDATFCLSAPFEPKKTFSRRQKNASQISRGDRFFAEKFLLSGSRCRCRRCHARFDCVVKFRIRERFRRHGFNRKCAAFDCRGCRFNSSVRRVNRNTQRLHALIGIVEAHRTFSTDPIPIPLCLTDELTSFGELFICCACQMSGFDYFVSASRRLTCHAQKFKRVVVNCLHAVQHGKIRRGTSRNLYRNV